MRHVRRQPDEEQRASFAELFFDLVFVFVVTQLSSLLFADLTARGAAKALFLLLVAWWAWIYTTWVTNWFDPETLVVRAILLVGMLASLIGAVALPDAFGSRAALLVLGYVGIQSFRNAFIVLATAPEDPLRRPFQRILGWTAGVAVVWVAGLFVDGEARVAVWLVALVLDYLGPFAGHWTPGLGRSRPSEWHLEPSHFVERLELFLIIALGESIVAAGVTASHMPLTLLRVLALVVAFLITTLLWWLYFDFHAERELESLRAAESERGRLGRDLSYLHIPLIAGIIVVAVANELVIRDPAAALRAPEVAALAAGPVLYLLGSVLFKIRVLRTRWEQRLVAAVLVVAATVAGAGLPSLALWTGITALLAVLAAFESTDRIRRLPHPHRLAAGR